MRGAISRKCFAGTHDLKIVFQFTAVGEHCGDDLARIKNASAADAENQIALITTRKLGCFFCQGRGRLTGDVERHTFDAAIAYLAKKRLGPFCGAAGDNAGTVSHLCRQRRNFADSSGAEYDAASRCKLESHDYSRLSKGVEAIPLKGSKLPRAKPYPIMATYPRKNGKLNREHHNSNPAHRETHCRT